MWISLFALFFCMKLQFFLSSQCLELYSRYGVLISIWSEDFFCCRVCHKLSKAYNKLLLLRKILRHKFWHQKKKAKILAFALWHITIKDAEDKIIFFSLGGVICKKDHRSEENWDYSDRSGYWLALSHSCVMFHQPLKILQVSE